jgi:hypothetical protein
MISDGNKEIKQSAENALSEFLREVKEAEVVEFGPMVCTQFSQSHSYYSLCPKPFFPVPGENSDSTMSFQRP